MTCILLLAGMLIGADTSAITVPSAGETKEGIGQMEKRSERIRTAFNGLSKDTIDSALDGFYAPEVTFTDPLGTIAGLASLKAYYAHMYESVSQVRFEFTDEVAQGDTHVVMWTMHLCAKGINKGKEVTATGNSVLRFGPEDTVIYHRDYFDMGEFIYQHIPILRFLVRKVNGALEHKE